METSLRIAGVVNDSVVDGPGLRYVIFCQGCKHHCEGCHNPETQPCLEGFEMKIEDLVEAILANPLLDGVTFSGGEPFLQLEGMLTLMERLRKANKKLNILAYSGYTYEQLKQWSLEEVKIVLILKQLDFLIDGPFIMELKKELPYRGSSNQRILRLKEGEIIEIIG